MNKQIIIDSLFAVLREIIKNLVLHLHKFNLLILYSIAVFKYLDLI